MRDYPDAAMTERENPGSGKSILRRVRELYKLSDRQMYLAETGTCPICNDEVRIGVWRGPQIEYVNKYGNAISISQQIIATGLLLLAPHLPERNLLHIYIRCKMCHGKWPMFRGHD